jgi:hypothetical protein
MTSRTLLLVALALTVACRKNPPPAPPQRPTTTAPPVVDASVAAAPTLPTPSADAAAPGSARPVVFAVRVRNIGTTPIRILTNPDANEMVHAWRLMITEDRSDRAAIALNDPGQMQRVKLFPVELPVCGSDASAGFGGLGQTGEITLQPDQSHEVGRWDGLQREEVNDPVRGVCLREYAPPPGRYRLQFDQPQDNKPSCARVMFRFPYAPDGGPAVIEIRCREATRDAGGTSTAREEE